MNSLTWFSFVDFELWRISLLICPWGTTVRLHEDDTIPRLEYAVIFIDPASENSISLSLTVQLPYISLSVKGLSLNGMFQA